MKNLLLISFLLVFHFSFSQIEKKDNSFIKTPFFNSNIEENHFVTNNKPLNLFPEIIKLEIKDLKNNSEGKFALNSNNEKYFKQKFNKTASSIIVEKTLVKNEKSDHLTTGAKKEFVDKVIIKKMEEEMRNFISMNEVVTYGDKNLDVYKNYSDLKNKLIVSYPIKSEVELQIGKDIYPYLDKILKTELDKTLQNSLNLLVINL